MKKMHIKIGVGAAFLLVASIAGATVCSDITPGSTDDGPEGGEADTCNYVEGSSEPIEGGGIKLTPPHCTGICLSISYSNYQGDDTCSAGSTYEECPPLDFDTYTMTYESTNCTPEEGSCKPCNYAGANEQDVPLLFIVLNGGAACPDEPEETEET